MVHESTKDRFVEELEYVEFVQTHKTKKLVKSTYKYWDRQDSWFGKTKDLAETEQFAMHGWDAGLKLLEDEDVKLNVHGNVKTINDIAGSIVDIGGYVGGRPDHMIQFVDEVNRNKPELTVYVDIAYNGGWSASRIMKYTIAIMKHINGLQSDYDVRIVAVNVLGCYGGMEETQGELFINIKKLDEPFVINSIAFSFHPSFFRRMWHYYLNSRKEIATGGGARLLSKSTVVSAVKKFHESKYGHTPALMLPTLEHDKGDLDNLSLYTKINFHDKIKQHEES